MAPQRIPTFYLYGEPHRAAEENFVHVEALDDRSRPSEWTIKPHAHADLIQLLAIHTGGGSMHADGDSLPFPAPCLLIVPATIVHGFDWLEDSTGTVITMAIRYVGEVIRHEAAFTRLLDTPRAVRLGKDDARRIETLVPELMRELGWSAPGHRAAVDSAILAILVIGLRNAGLEDRPAPRLGHHASTVARLRERIEQRFRLREPISTYAVALGVSQTALRVGCARIAGSSPSQMLDGRALLEARRALLYTNLSISEIGFSIGFNDPAYFSRFFSRNTGRSPLQFRVDHDASLYR